MTSNRFFSKLLEKPSPIKFEEHFKESKEPNLIMQTFTQPNNNHQINPTVDSSVNFNETNGVKSDVKVSSPPRIYAAKLSERLAQKTKGIANIYYK
jgi:hypothetical protein